MDVETGVSSPGADRNKVNRSPGETSRLPGCEGNDGQVSDDGERSRPAGGGREGTRESEAGEMKVDGEWSRDCNRVRLIGDSVEEDPGDDYDYDPSAYYDSESGRGNAVDRLHNRSTLDHESSSPSAYSPHIRLTTAGEEEEEMLVISPACPSQSPRHHHHQHSHPSSPRTSSRHAHNYRSSIDANDYSAYTAYTSATDTSSRNQGAEHAYALTSLAVAAEKDRQSKEEKRVARAVMVVAGTLILMSLILVGVTLSMSDHIDEMG